MPKTRVLIAVKTYPTLSAKYDELVCTAGFLEDGTWIRIYPIKFRSLDYSSQYKKYEWVELDLVRNTSDFRPESYRPRTHDEQPVVVGAASTANNWAERKTIVNQKVWSDLAALIAASHDKSSNTSLAVFRPTEILKFEYEQCERDWDADKLALLNQQNIFETKGGKEQVVKKLPYKFYYKFKDVNGKISRMMIEDWEIGALYWNALYRAGGDEIVACEKVKEKYLTEFAEKDLLFFLGTRLKEHAKGYTNPFSIIGVFYPKKEVKPTQMSLF